MSSEPKVFISYRREDTSGHAGRLYDAMAARFGEPNVFVDVDLDPGVDFVHRIREAIGACRVLLVVMGPRWATLPDEAGDPRLADAEDFVRLEVETALNRPDLTVIPVLVAGGQMPDPDDLPEGLRPLTRRNAIELSDMRWRYDVGRLNGPLDGLLTGSVRVQPAQGAAQPPAAEPVRRGSSALRFAAEAMVVAGLAALVARLVADPIDPGTATSDAGRIAATIGRRAVTWAVLGAALGVWLSFVRGEARLLAGRALLGLGLGALAGAVGGAVVALPQYLPAEEPSRSTLDAIMVGSWAASGAVLGILLGALWVPRSIAAGFLAGLAAGALVRLLWNASGANPDGAFQDSVGIGIECLLIVGLVVASLQLLNAQPRPGHAARAAPGH
jgi:hypothetical protein